MTTTFTRGENPLKADKLNLAISERIARIGDTMTGMLTLAADPVAAFDAATKQYVDRFTAMGVPTGAYIGSAPPGNTLGPLWWDTNSGQLYIQYNDGTSTQWVSANSIDAAQLEGSFLPLTGGNVSGPVKFGTGTNTAAGGSFLVAHDDDPATPPGVNYRENMFVSNLSYGVTTGNIWENLNSFVYVKGPGTASGEINVIHAYLDVATGANTAMSECFEASMTNNGHIGSHMNFLAISYNTASGTADSLSGLELKLTNLNTAAGSIGQWNGINFNGMDGGGSVPTFYNAIRIADPRLGIVTLGGIKVGGLGPPSAGQLVIQSNDSSGGTFPFIWTNPTDGNLLYFQNNGVVTFAAAGVVIRPPSLGSVLNLSGKDNAAATLLIEAHNLALTAIFDVNNAGEVGAGAAYKVNSQKVVGPRDFGWQGMGGTPDKTSVFTTTTVTLPQLAARVAALQAVLTTHGLIGP